MEKALDDPRLSEVTFIIRSSSGRDIGTATFDLSDLLKECKDVTHHALTVDAIKGSGSIGTLYIGTIAYKALDKLLY